MPLYTRTGDDGTTGMVGGERIEKDSLRIHAVGDVDEVNAVLGTVDGTDLQPLQSLLFELGAELASPNEEPRIFQTDISNIEQWIDVADEENEPLKTFVLPGGTPVAATLHVARTVCRRAERNVVSLYRKDGCRHEAVVLLNRISDLLFAQARRVNRLHGVSDIPWTPREKE